MKKALILLLSVVYMLSLYGCSSGAVVSNTSLVSQSDTTASPEAEKQYKIGDEIFINNSEGEYKIVFTGIRETDERNQFSDKQAKRVVIISYEYENISKNSDLYISELNCKLYDKQNNSLETYPANIKASQSVGTGRKSSGEMAYALNSADNYIELEYYDNMFNSKSDCKVVIEW